jgi:hypothetical protein
MFEIIGLFAGRSELPKCKDWRRLIAKARQGSSSGFAITLSSDTVNIGRRALCGGSLPSL